MTSIRDRLLAEPDSMAWPYLGIGLMIESLEAINPHTDLTKLDGLRVFDRMLAPEDDTETVGVYPTRREPDGNTVEMRGKGASLATFHTYPIEVMSWVTDADQKLGLRVHAQLAALIFEALTASEILEDDLPGLQYTYPSGLRETAARWGVENQEYVSSEFGTNDFGFVSLTRFYITTQIS